MPFAGRVYFPPMKPVPEDATADDRAKMLKDYKAELVKLNPGHFNADGTQKTVLQLLCGLFK